MRSLTRGLALSAQAFEFLFERAEFSHALRDVADMRIEQCVDLAAVLGRRVLEPQQYADLVERHVQAATVTNKGKPLYMRIGVDPIVALGPFGDRQQAFALIKADGFDLSARRGGQFADLHGVTRQGKRRCE